MVVVADGSDEADAKLERVLTCDPGWGSFAMRMRVIRKRLRLRKKGA